MHSEDDKRLNFLLDTKLLSIYIRIQIILIDGHHVTALILLKHRLYRSTYPHHHQLSNWL